MIIKDFVKKHRLEEGDKVLIVNSKDFRFVGKNAKVKRITENGIDFSLEEVYYNDNGTKRITLYEDDFAVTVAGLKNLVLKNLDKPTLFERIKGMNSLELAEFLLENGRCDICILKGKCSDGKDCLKGIFQGLKEV